MNMKSRPPRERPGEVARIINSGPKNLWMLKQFEVKKGAKRP